MKIQVKDNFWGYFKFYYNILGTKFLINLGMGVVVSFLDGIGLAMFIPLLQSADPSTAGQAADKKESGGVHLLTDFISSLGIPLTINYVLLILVVLFIAKGLLKFVQQNYQVNLWHLFMRKMRYTLLDNLQGLSYSGFLKFDAGIIQNTLSSEVQRLYQSIKFYFTAMQSGVLLVTYIAMAFVSNYQFAILVTIGAGLSNLIYKKIYTSTKKSSIGVAKKGNEFSSYLTQAIHHFKYLKSTNYFNRYAIHLKNVIQSAEQLNKKMGFSSAITNSFKEPMIIIIVTGVIYLQLNVFNTGMASILFSLLLFYRALSFLLLVQNYWQNFIQNAGSITSVGNLINDMRDMQETEISQTYPGLKGQLHLDKVSFSYGDNKVIDDVDIVIPRNKTIAFVGESGSGKTTLANIICGLIDPQQGNVAPDDVPLKNYNRNSFRDKIGYISQEAVIFNDNIFNNITFWAEPTPENIKKFWEVIELSSLKSVIEAQPAKEHTMLGDNGLLVSGGQKQRISIARELYKSVDILILDEATSALDSETERFIQDNIEKLHGSYTIVIIAHRLSTIKTADMIYLLEKGKVAASGTFNEIIERSERFKRMVSLQEV